MKLPLNEWAAAIRSETFIGNEPWNEFEQLVKTLANEYDIQKILFTKSDASDLQKEFYALQSRTEQQRMKTFYDKYIEKYTVSSFSDEYICREVKMKESVAVLLTVAYSEKVPTVSILYDDAFACDSFKACLFDSRKEKGKTVILKNLHIENLEIYKEFFLTGIPPRELNPQSNPIWNVEKTKKYYDTLPSLIGLSKEEKNYLFIQEGTHVARLNGWEKDKNLSEINSTSQKMRHVFRPKKFKDKDAAFLSIDFEKRAFELLNHRGKHLGEISYLGEKNTGPKPNHDIKLKR